MSTRNGDRARARREQQKKLLRRQRAQEVRQELKNTSEVPAVPASVMAEPKTAPTD